MVASPEYRRRGTGDAYIQPVSVPVGAERVVNRMTSTEGYNLDEHVPSFLSSKDKSTSTRTRGT